MADSIEWIRDCGGFAGLAEPWDRLAGDAALPFDLHCWYEAWWKAFRGRERLALCTAWRGEELSGVLPLMRGPGRQLHGLANVHTPVFRPLARDDDALDAVIRAALGAGASSLELEALPAEERSLAALERVAGEVGWPALTERQHVSPIIETTGDFESWSAATRKQWRTNIPRLRRKMSREHEAELTLVEPPHDLEAQLERGLMVEASGWKQGAGTAILLSAETAAFYRGIARAFHERGELRLSEIVLDGQLVAFDLCILRAGRLHLIKIGFDESYRKLAPGLVLRLATIERCFELGLEAHELLGDDAPWKRKFASSERVHHVFRAYSRRPAPLARRSYRTTLRPLLRRGYRTLRPPRGGD